MSQPDTTTVLATSGPDADAPTLVLIDGHALFHRSFHAFPDEMSTVSGEPTNAVFGFARMLLDVLRILKPDFMAVTFDRPTPTFRHKAFGPYKAHRPSLPDSMRAQFPRVREIVTAFNMPIYELDGFEADDLLGTLSLQAEKQQVKTTIATGDLDTLQLIDDWVRVTFARSPRSGQFDFFDTAAMRERYGFVPERLVDYKALVGDTSDNIPGVPGIGAKTAAKLIEQYATLENILDHADEQTPRIRASLTENADQARHSKFLATIVRDAPVSLDLESARALHYDPDRVLALFRTLEFHSLVDRLPRRRGEPDSANAAETATAAAVPALIPDIGDENGPASVSPLSPQGEGTGMRSPDIQLSLFDESALQSLAEEGTDMPGFRADVPPVAARPRVEPTTGTNTMVIDTPAALDVLAHTLANADIFAFDLETDSTNEMQANIVGLSFSSGPGEAYYIPTGHISTPDGEEQSRQLPIALVLDKLRPALTNGKIGKTGHNAKYDMMVLARHGVLVEGLRFDSMVGAYLLNPGRRNLGLKEQAFENLGIIMTPIADLIGTGKNQISMAQTPIRAAADYAGADADMTLRLFHHIRPQLEQRHLENLMTDVEVPLIPVLARMELSGIRVDADFLMRMGRELDEQVKALEQEVYAAVGHQFTINSTKQLGEVLFGELKLPRGRKTKTGYSVDADELERLRGAHPVVDLIEEFRQLGKLKSTYVDGLVELLNPEDRRVHTSFNQTISATGRLSSSNPNLQNIPIRTEVGRRIRRAFLADEGCYLLTADYSQIELRILAHITHEPALVAAFEHDEDIHAATASQLFKVSLAEVTPDQRRLAKTVNFAVLYGQSAFGLARVTGMANSEAVEFIRNYETTFPLVREYVQTTLHQARTLGYVQTLLGRRRYMPDMASLPVNLRQAAEREAVNMPIQGTNADMIKIAMVSLQRQLDAMKLATRMILQVHDELVLEVPDPEIDVVSELVRDAMVGAMTLSVPVKVEQKTGRNWYEVQPLA
ncbi:MAG TPA: DNA polymerase I [Ktedonobacterales bacterium]|nr:DNA polymerase I [Ktedonobacterales bacterium]